MIHVDSWDLISAMFQEPEEVMVTSVGVMV